MSKWKAILGTVGTLAGAAVLGIISSKANLSQNDEAYTTIVLIRLALDAYETEKEESQDSKLVRKLVDEAYEFYADATPTNSSYISECRKGEEKLREAEHALKQLPNYELYLEKARRHYKEIAAQHS